MCGRVGRAAHRVSSLRDDLVDAAGNDGADRYLAVCRSLVGEVERAAHRGRQREAHRRSASRARERSHMVLFVAAGAWLSAGFCTSSFGTFTVFCWVPTFTEPVSTSNAGAWPPFAVTPLWVAAICGTCAPRIWLMLM